MLYYRFFIYGLNSKPLKLLRKYLITYFIIETISGSAVATALASKKSVKDFHPSGHLWQMMIAIYGCMLQRIFWPTPVLNKYFKTTTPISNNQPPIERAACFLGLACFWSFDRSLNY